MEEKAHCSFSQHETLQCSRSARFVLAFVAGFALTTASTAQCQQSLARYSGKRPDTARATPREIADWVQTNLPELAGGGGTCNRSEADSFYADDYQYSVTAIDQIGCTADVAYEAHSEHDWNHNGDAGFWKKTVANVAHVQFALLVGVDKDENGFFAGACTFSHVPQLILRAAPGKLIKIAGSEKHENNTDQKRPDTPISENVSSYRILFADSKQRDRLALATRDLIQQCGGKLKKKKLY